MVLLDVKRPQKLSILTQLFYRKNGGVLPKWFAFLSNFGILIPCSIIYFLEGRARVSLKVAASGPLRGKKTLKK